jgi:hypothetical protein
MREAVYSALFLLGLSAVMITALDLIGHIPS